MLLETEGKKVYLPGNISLCRLGSLGLVNFAAAVHPRCTRLALYLGGSNCNAVAAEIPIREQENKAVDCFGYGIVRCNQQ